MASKPISQAIGEPLVPDALDLMAELTTKGVKEKNALIRRWVKALRTTPTLEPPPSHTETAEWSGVLAEVVQFFLSRRYEVRVAEVNKPDSLLAPADVKPRQPVEVTVTCPRPSPTFFSRPAEADADPVPPEPEPEPELEEPEAAEPDTEAAFRRDARRLGSFEGFYVLLAHVRISRRARLEHIAGIYDTLVDAEAAKDWWLYDSPHSTACVEEVFVTGPYLRNRVVPIIENSAAAFIADQVGDTTINPLEDPDPLAFDYARLPHVDERVRQCGHMRGPRFPKCRRHMCRHPCCARSRGADVDMPPRERAETAGVFLGAPVPDLLELDDDDGGRIQSPPVRGRSRSEAGGERARSLSVDAHSPRRLLRTCSAASTPAIAEDSGGGGGAGVVVGRGRPFGRGYTSSCAPGPRRTDWPRRRAQA